MHTRQGSVWKKHRKALVVLCTIAVYCVIYFLHAGMAISTHEGEHGAADDVEAHLSSAHVGGHGELGIGKGSSLVRERFGKTRRAVKLEKDDPFDLHKPPKKRMTMEPVPVTKPPVDDSDEEEQHTKKQKVRQPVHPHLHRDDVVDENPVLDEATEAPLKKATHHNKHQRNRHHHQEPSEHEEEETKAPAPVGRHHRQQHHRAVKHDDEGTVDDEGNTTPKMEPHPGEEESQKTGAQHHQGRHHRGGQHHQAAPDAEDETENQHGEEHDVPHTKAPHHRHQHHKQQHGEKDGGETPGADSDEPHHQAQRRHHQHRKQKHPEEGDAPPKADKEEDTPAPHHKHHQHHKKPDDSGDGSEKPEHAEHKKQQPAAAGGGAHHHHHRRHHRKFDEKEQVAIDDIVAYSVVVSNEDFIDGALTLAWSFKNHSILFQEKKAHLVAVVAEGSISNYSIQRLQMAGWTEVVVQPDLTNEAPKAHYAPTFNKLYLFNLTRYSRVAYFDVDMLMLRNPDEIFKTHLPDNEHIGALGNNPKSKKPYFQSGMMLIAPSAKAFDSMMHDFRTNPYHKTINGRDGAIIRKYYKDRYVQLDDALSAHLGIHEPLDSVIGFHFRGSWKPWFDVEHPPTEPDKFVANKKPQPLQEMGEAYRLWWHCYEDMHRHVFMDAEERTHAYNPKIQVSLMRNTKRAYVQLLSDVAVQRRNMTFSKLVLEKSLQGESCDFVCAFRQGVCSEEALSFSEVNKCDRLKEYYGCKTCTMDHPGAEQPGYDIGSKKCLVNPLYYKTYRPNCTAKHTHTKRLCPCIPIDRVNERPVAFGVYGLPPSKTNNKYEAGLVVDAKDEHQESGCFPSHTDYYKPKKDGDDDVFSGDAKCLEYLRNPANIESVVPLGTTLWVGRTAKLMFHYKEAGIQAIVKFPQRSFPHEPHSEVIAHAVDRIGKFHRVPPTTFAYFPRQMLADGFANVTNEHSKNATLKFVQEEVWSVVDGSSILSKVMKTMNPDSGKQESVPHVGVSVQLWLHDVHRLADSKLHVPKDYTRWFAFDAKKEPVVVPDARKFPQSDTSIFELSRMIVFDFIIGNDDRTPFKNCYVVGGCTKFCQSSTIALHEGPTQLVFLDQGRSMYYSKQPEGNPLNDIAKRNESDEKEENDKKDPRDEAEEAAEKKNSETAESNFCRFSKPVYERLRHLSRWATATPNSRRQLSALASRKQDETSDGEEGTHPPTKHSVHDDEEASLEPHAVMDDDKTPPTKKQSHQADAGEKESPEEDPENPKSDEDSSSKDKKKKVVEEHKKNSNTSSSEGKTASLEKQVLAHLDTIDAFVSYVGESKFDAMQQRLEKAIQHMEWCRDKFGAEQVFFTEDDE